MCGVANRLYRRHPCLQRRGFRGVKPRRFDIARPFSCFALMQAGMPAVQSVGDNQIVVDEATNLSTFFPQPIHTRHHNLLNLPISRQSDRMFGRRYD